MEEKIEEKEKKLQCPFRASNDNLECEDCRLYIIYTGGGGLRSCILNLCTTR